MNASGNDWDFRSQTSFGGAQALDTGLGHRRVQDLGGFPRRPESHSLGAGPAVSTLVAWRIENHLEIIQCSVKRQDLKSFHRRDTEIAEGFFKTFFSAYSVPLR